MPLAPSLTAPQQAASSDSSMRKLMRQIGQGAASGAAVVGNTLNKPSRAFWGTLDQLAGGHGGGGLLNLIPFSDTMGLTDPSQGVEASQFLANRGIISQNDPNKWEAMDFGRGLIDAVGDPLGWVAPMGLTKAGVAATRAGTAAKGIIPSIARGERAILGLQAPFATKTFASLGTGASAAAGLQKAGAMAAKLPGASKAMKVGDGVRRWWKQAFDAKAMGARSAAGQAGGELASELSQKYAQSVDDVVIPAARELHQSGAGDGSVAQRAFGETGKAGRPITPVESTAVTSVQDLLSNLRLKAKSAGLKVGGLLKDVVDYLPRSLSGMPAKSRSRSMWSVVDPGDAERLQVLKGFHGGTEGVNTLFRDADIDKLVSTLKGSPAWLSDKKLRKQTIDTVEAMLRSKYGSVIEPTYQVKLRKGGVLQYDIDPVTGKKTPKMKDVDRIKQLAKKVVKMDDWRKNGVFNNHWLVDAQSRAQSLAHRTALAEAAVDVLAKNGKRGVPGTPLKDIIGKAGIGLDTDVAVNNILAARGKGSLASYGKKANSVRRRILNETVDDSVADDLMRAWPAFRTPPELNDLQKGWKNFTALWKAGQLTWPARYVRDLASASMRLWENGAIDPQSFKQAHNVLQGRAVPGLADIPAVVDHLRSRGVLPAAGAVDDAMATNALRDLYGTHFTQPGGMLTDTLQTGSTANARPLSEITDRIPGLDPKSELQSIKEIGMRSVGRDPSGSPIPGSWNPLNVRGYGDNNRSTFGPVAAGDRVGTYTDSVARMTGFINRLRSGADPAAAAKEINNLLVDYSPKSFTPTERALKAFLPFYSFTSRQIPYLAKELVMNPGGRTSQLVRGTARAQSNDPFLPEHISQTTAIPIGQSEDGTKRFVTGFGLMHEDPLSFLGGGVQGAMTETMSRMNPIPKSVIEWGTGESLFQRGPMGGRDLGDMDPTIGRLLSNIGESTGLMEPGSGPVRFPAQTPIEFMIGNSPFSRAASTARSAFDPRKSAAAKMANILTGTRVSDVSTKTQDAVLRDAATKLGKEIGAKEFSSIRFRKQDIANLEKVDPAAAEMAKAFNNLQNQLSGRVKARNNNTGSAKARKTVSKPEGARL